MVIARLAPFQRHRTLVTLTIVQMLCAVWFLYDVLSEVPQLWLNPWHQIPEVTAVAALWTGSILGARKIRQLVGQNQEMETRLRTASGAFLDMLEENFRRWSLTPSERDVALLAIKGFSVSEIAALRETRPGTVKAQCAAVYRKAGVSGRAQLLALFVDDLMDGVALDTAAE
jgi:DNA-binding CsgD family transcriptional regulator